MKRGAGKGSPGSLGSPAEDSGALEAAREFDEPREDCPVERTSESLEADGEDSYTASLNIGVGPIRGVYKARLALSDKKPGEGYTISVDGSGKPGFVKGTGKVRLEPEGDVTKLHYSGDLQVGGLIARVGQRMIGGITRQMTNKFFEGLGRETGDSE